MILRPAMLALLLAASAPAGAQPDPRLPVLTPAQSARVDALAGRALAAFEALPAEKRPEAASKLVGALMLVRRCRLIDPLLRAYPFAARSIPIVPHPEMVDSDPDCSDRLLTHYAQPNPPGSPKRDPHTLYTAGALWQRIGKADKAEGAIEEAERELAELESADTADAWSCHGGYCLSRLWSTRLFALRLTRGTPRHKVMLRWAATLALSHAAARDAHRPAPFIGYAVFEELLPMALDAGDESLARLIAEHSTYDYPPASAAHRMRRLFEQGRIAEALELWPDAGTGFATPITPLLLRTHLPHFHRWREQLRHRLWREPAELLSLMAMAWIERGEPDRAREALVTARAHRERVKGYGWDLEFVQRLLAVEAMLEGGGDPADWLRRRSFPAGDSSSEHDYAFRELAAMLAASGRQAEARRALGEIRDPRTRRSFLVELPCRAAYGSDSAAAADAVALARTSLRPGSAREEKDNPFANRAYQTFACLVRAHRGEAAIAYARAIADPKVRLSLLSSMPLGSGIPTEPALRRRVAELAFALVRSHGLGDDDALPYIAADFERAGDFESVERVLERARGGEARVGVLHRLLRAYGPDLGY